MERNSRNIVKRLLMEGWEDCGARGSHHKFRKGGATVIVPHPKKDLPEGGRAEHREDGRLALKRMNFRAGKQERAGSMSYFYALVQKDQDSAYGVTFPDLPGCFSAADELEQVLTNAIEAIEFWMEDSDSVPEARGLAAIHQAEAAALGEGAFLLAVPYIRHVGRQVRANISLDRGMLDAIDAAAAQLRLTRSAFLVEAARNEIEGRHLADV